MIQIDNDYTGKDFSASIKALNPSFLEGGVTGICIGSYLQSITPGLALGMEAIWQRQAMSMGPDLSVSYVAKYRGSDWIAAAQLAAAGALTTSYWRKIGEKVEVGAELQLQLQQGPGRGAMMGGRMQREGIANIGAKYDFRTASLRAQADSNGKLSVTLEKRLLQAQAIQVMFAGELDQLKVCLTFFLFDCLVLSKAPDTNSQHSNKPKSASACRSKFQMKILWSSRRKHSTRICHRLPTRGIICADM